MKVEINTYQPGEISRDEKKCYKISLHISKNSTVTLEAMSLEDITNIRNSLETEIQRVQGESLRNDVASYIYYMYNYWTKEECYECFKNNTVCNVDHLWDKYEAICEVYGVEAAPMRFFVELGDTLQDILTQRATSLYNRRTKIC